MPDQSSADSTQFDELQLSRQICFSIYQASNALIRAYKPLLDPLDLTYPQYLVMLALWEKDETTIRGLAARVLMDPAQLTPLLKRLEGKGMLTRGRNGPDERSKSIRLTPFGQGLKEKASRVPIELAEKTKMSLEEGQQLKYLADKLILGLTGSD